MWSSTSITPNLKLFSMYAYKDVTMRNIWGSFPKRMMAVIRNHLKNLFEQLAAVEAPIQDVPAVIALLGCLPNSYKSLITSLKRESRLTLHNCILCKGRHERNIQGWQTKKPKILYHKVGRKFKKKVVDLQLQNKGPLQLDCKSLKKQGTDVVIAETRTPPKECLKSIANEEKDKANVAI